MNVSLIRIRKQWCVIGLLKNHYLNTSQGPIQSKNKLDKQLKETEVVIKRNPGSIIWTKISAIIANRVRESMSSNGLISWEEAFYFARRYIFPPLRGLYHLICHPFNTIFLLCLFGGLFFKHSLFFYCIRDLILFSSLKYILVYGQIFGVAVVSMLSCIDSKLVSPVCCLARKENFIITHT